MIIDGITAAEGNDENLRNYVKGEALVWRAYSYFKLIQYYSPYKEDDYGIPVFLKPYDDPGNAMPQREKQSDVYRQILTDCQEVIDLIAETPSNQWNCAYEPRAIAGRSFVRDQSVYDAMFDTPAQQTFRNDEFYLRLVDGRNGQIANFIDTYFQTSEWGPAEANPSQEFYAQYKEDDVRKKTFFRTKTDGKIIFDKYNISNDPMAFLGAGGIIMPFRLAETCLIKAEALYRLGKTTEAKEVLDDFKQGRYLDVEGSYTESDLLNEILKERKLEFYHEQDMWWLDMKRLQTRMERIVNGTMYILEPDDFRYSLPIPPHRMYVFLHSGQV